MFRKTATENQLTIFSNISGMLNGTARKQFDDTKAWHNLFREEVYSYIDESAFSGLFSDKMGAPNASVRMMVSMMVLKEGFGWSDSELFEQCHFNLLVRSALGLFNINDKLPAESTYYLFRKRVHSYCKEHGIDLIEATFQAITRTQAKEYNVNGKSIRMDSKLIGSNISWCTRYELIHETISHFLQKADKKLVRVLSALEQEQLSKVCVERGEKVVYRNNREGIQNRLYELGLLMYKLVQIYDKDTECYDILSTVFNEQYRIESEQVILRPKEELVAENVQSPHDTDCTYRKKDKQEVKGYAVNLTETCDKDSLNLITDVQVENASIADNEFVATCTCNTFETTGRVPENLHADGAYHSTPNVEFCDNAEINFYCTGIQGAAGKYDLIMTDEVLVVTDTTTGEIVPCEKNNGKNWKIRTESGYRYFTPDQIASCERRRFTEQLPWEIKTVRNNVESSIFQLSFKTRNNKTRYRGILKHKLWATFRCLWINFRRICKWVGELCPASREKRNLAVLFLFFPILQLVNWLTIKFYHQYPDLFKKTETTYARCHY